MYVEQRTWSAAAKKKKNAELRVVLGNGGDERNVVGCLQKR